MTSDQISNILNLFFRWVHVIAGVMWIGHLWFFNFVNSQVAKTYDADSKKKVLPELMPRALYWFRWGAAYTWLSGILLLGIVYYSDKAMMSETMPGAATGVGIAVVLLAFFIYDPLWKAMGKNEMAATAVSFVLLVVVSIVFQKVLQMTGRAMFIHMGAMFGTIMAMNVWMRIWPAQRKIIAGVKGTAAAPDPAVAAMAGLRSKHNTYLSVPLIFAMISNHFYLVGSEWAWLIFDVIVLLGWLMAKRMYGKSGQAAPASF